ncbi:MAG: YggT family protein [Burkholderiales bacterium]|nr:YggT family protein [Burkholderiales bacterium]
MLFQIISLLLEVVTGVVGGACLLRLYMQHQRIPMSSRSGNPLGLILAAFGVVRLAISGLTGLVIVYAVLSWLQSSNVLTDVIDRLVAPPLAPIRRLVPLVGGIDLSPLVLLVLLQVAAIVLGSLQGMALVY